MPRPFPLDSSLPDIVSAGQAYRAGLTPDQVRQRLRSGRWTRLAHGVYRTRESARDDDPWAVAKRAHADRAVAEALAHPGFLVGFASGAAVLDLPTWRSPGPDVDLIAPAGGHNGRRPGVVVHRLELHEDHIVSQPVPMTSVARTWLDVTRGGSLVDGLVLGDAALRAGLVTPADLAMVLDTCWARRGIRTARQAVKHVDGARETPLESASWAYFIVNKVPLPRMQVEISTVDGRFIARVDFLWDDPRLVGECDGRMKYVTADDLYAEKRREDAIRAEGYQVLRWSAADLSTPLLAHRIRRVHT